MYNDKPSPKQISLINKMKSALKVNFTGKTKQEASQFISENMEAYNLFKDNNLCLTQKQQDFVAKAMLELNLTFDCKNNQEASIWISNAMRRLREKNSKGSKSSGIVLE